MMTKLPTYAIKVGPSTNRDIEIDRELAVMVRHMALGLAPDPKALHRLAELLNERADLRQAEINR